MDRLTGGKGIASIHAPRRAILLVLTIAFSAFGCTKPIAQQEEEALIGVGYSRDTRKARDIQLILMYNGFGPKYVDGALGPGTRKAIKKFQKSMKLPPSGYVGKETWAEMMKSREKGGPSTVMDIQSALRRAGFDPGAVDGQLGAQTRDMIGEFQAAKGMETTRTINPETWAVLKEHSQ